MCGCRVSRRPLLGAGDKSDPGSQLLILLIPSLSPTTTYEVSSSHKLPSCRSTQKSGGWAAPDLTMGQGQCPSGAGLDSAGTSP